MRQKTITVSNESNGKRRTITVSSSDPSIMEDIVVAIRTAAHEHNAAIINATDPFGKPKAKAAASNSDEHRAADADAERLRELAERQGESL